MRKCLTDNKKYVLIHYKKTDTSNDASVFPYIMICFLCYTVSSDILINAGNHAL